MFDYGQILLHELPRNVRDFPETSPKKTSRRRVSGKFQIVPDFIETSLKGRDISKSLGQVRNFPRQVGATPGVSPTIKSHSHVTYYYYYYYFFLIIIIIIINDSIYPAVSKASRTSNKVSCQPNDCQQMSLQALLENGQ